MCVAQLYSHMPWEMDSKRSDLGVFGTSGVGANVLSHADQYQRNSSTSEQPSYCMTYIKRAAIFIREKLAASCDPNCFRIIETPMLRSDQCAALRSCIDNYVKQEYNGRAPGDLILRLRLGEVYRLLDKATMDRLRGLMRYPFCRHRVVLRRSEEHGKFIDFRLNNAFETLEVRACPVLTRCVFFPVNCDFPTLTSLGVTE